MSKAFSPPDGSGALDDDRPINDDWITIWHSELAAIAVDRELQEYWQLVVSFCTGAARAVWTAPAQQTTADAMHGDGPAGSAEADAAAGAAATAAAPDDGVDAIERLGRRVDGLERLLAGIERDRAGPGRPRKRRS